MPQEAITPAISSSVSDPQTDLQHENACSQPSGSSPADPSNNHKLTTPDSLKDKYLYIQDIGHGSQAHVYLAIRLEDGKHVIIKQLNIGSVKNWKEYELFNREASVLSSLHIDGVALFYEALECLEDNPPCSYIVQEYIQGTSLGQMIQSGHRFKVNEVYDIIIQLLRILYQLQSHTPPVIHRDIKPSNIMISRNETNQIKVTLIDFGAVANPQVQSGGSTVAGTYGYMPPEQLMGKPVPASDIYSVAAVAVEMFTGKSPAILPTRDFRLIFEPEMEQMPQALINTLRQMLAPKVEERLSNISELVSTFENFKSDQYKTAYKVSNQRTGILQKLEKIQSFGDPGNLDIWQSLPDVTPRIVPELTNRDLFNIRKPLPDIIKPSGQSSYGFCIFLFLCICFLIIANIFISTILVPSVIILPFLVLILIISFVITNLNNAVSVPDSGSDYSPETSLIQVNTVTPSALANANNQAYNLYRNTLEYGRKTIATITSITYIPLRQKLQRERSLYIYPRQPAFKIIYKFNPPDDSKGDIDLFHSCIVHEVPEGHYKVGDPFPILYTLDNDLFSERLVSIPFPFPLYSVDLKEICYEQNNKLTNVSYSPNNTQYVTCLLPLIKAIKSNDRNNLITAIENIVNFSPNTFSDHAIFELLLETGNHIFERNDNELNYHYMNALHYIATKDNILISHGSIDNLILSFLTKNSNYITPGAIHGLLNHDRYIADISMHDSIDYKYLTPSYNHLFFVIIHSWCHIIANSGLNSQLPRHLIINIKDTITTLSQLNYFSAFTNAILTSPWRFNHHKCFDQEYRDLFDIIYNIITFNNYHKTIIDILSVILENPHSTELDGLITPDMLVNPEFEPIQALVAEYLCATDPMSLLNYIPAISEHPYILHGIACYFKNHDLVHNTSLHQINIYDALLRIYPTADPETKRWMRLTDSNSAYLAHFPEELAHKVFHTPELSDLSLAVLFSCSQLPENAYLNVIRDYFSQDLMKNESQHIRVFKALVKLLPQIFKDKLTPFLRISITICQHCSNNFFNIIMEQIRNEKFSTSTFYEYIMKHTSAGKATD